MKLWVSLLFAAGCVSSCKIEPPTDTAPEPLVNECDRDADCTTGYCELAAGRCGRRSSEFKALLIEVVPPASDQIYGGRQFYHKVTVGDSGVPMELVLERQDLDGRVTLWLGNCAGHQIMFTLCPRIEALGLRPTRLSIDVPTDAVQLQNGDRDFSTLLNRFTLETVPLGRYDAYFTDSGYEAFTPDCPAPAVPHIERGLPLGDSAVPPLYRFDQNAPPPAELVVTVPWHDDLEGWVVDTVHNITAERMSTAARLDGAQALTEGDRSTVTVTLRQAALLGQDYRIATSTTPFSGAPFLRLRPPDATTRPTIYFASLVPSGATGAVPVAVPQFGPFSDLVHYRAWVWAEGDPSRPIRGKVVLSAAQDGTGLTDVRGVTATFTRSLVIAEDGLLEVDLLPGNYVADVIPERETGYGRYRTTLEVWGAPSDADAGTVQAGRLIAVPRAPVLTGHARGPGGVFATGATVRVTPSVRGGFTFTAQVQRFLPRESERIVDDDGRFALDVDCSSCSETAPSAFDVVVSTGEGSGLPWLVFRDLEVKGDLDLGRVTMQVPRWIFGQVLFRNQPTRPPLPHAGPRVRAYAMLDRDGNQVDDEGLPDCVDVEPPVNGEAGVPCVLRVIQIGEASTDGEGRFQLALPPSFADPE